MGNVFDLGQKDNCKSAKQYQFFYDVYELLYPLLTCVQNTIVLDTCHVNTQSVDVSESVCVSVDLRNLFILPRRVFNFRWFIVVRIFCL